MIENGADLHVQTGLSFGERPQLGLRILGFATRMLQVVRKHTKQITCSGRGYRVGHGKWQSIHSTRQLGFWMVIGISYKA